MLWTATNKKTGIDYGPYTDEEKAEYLKDEYFMLKHTLAPVPGSDKPKAPAPIEAKTLEQHKPKEEK